MGFSALRWRQAGRDWSRGSPPPRGSIEYVAVGDMFEPGPRATLSGSIWTISATELEAANRWCETLARSVDYARQVHGDRVLSADDARRFTDFYKRWLVFSGRVTTWSLYDRALEANKVVFEALLAESKQLRDKFTSQGMAIIPVPYATEIVLMLRSMPRRLAPSVMAKKLETVARWGEAMVRSSVTTSEWVQRAGMYTAAASVLGPAGLLVAHFLPTSWSKDRKGLLDAIDGARQAAKQLARASDGGATYGPGDPVYDEFLKKVSKIYVEAAGLYGFQETMRAASAEAVDAGTRKVEQGGDLLGLLVLAGVGYLGAKWLSSVGRSSDEVVVEIPDEELAGEPEPEPAVDPSRLPGQGDEWHTT